MGFALERAAHRSREDLAHAEAGLGRGIGSARERAGADVARLGRMLDLLSPERTVARGYAIVRDAGGAVVPGVARLGPGSTVRIDMRDGAAAAEITEVER
jgi:exodeoxyribonuclease VII large subunit